MAAYVKMIMRELLLPQTKEAPSGADREVVSALGIPYVEGKDPNQFVWNGYQLQIDNLDTPSNILHECAHYQVAPTLFRRQVEYGLGKAPNSLRFFEVTRLHTRAAPDDELLASLLGILWEKHLGYDHVNTLFAHNWVRNTFNPTWEEYAKHNSTETALETLYELGLISARGVPKVVVNGN